MSVKTKTGVCLLAAVLITIYVNLSTTNFIKIEIENFSFSSKLVIQYQENIERKKSIDSKRCFKTFQDLFKLHSTIGLNKPSNAVIFNNLTYPFRFTWLIEFDYSNLKNETKQSKQHISTRDLESKIQLIKQKHEYNSLNDVTLEEMFKRHLSFENKLTKRVAIFGLYDMAHDPWIESLVWLLSSNKSIEIDSIDYKPRSYELDQFKWIHTNQYLKKKLSSFKESSKKDYDILISHYSLNKIGLGRFGERVQLNADLNTMKQFHCMLKSNGLLFLTLGFSKDDEYAIEFNIRRVYSESRLEALLRKQWTLVDQILFNFGADKILVLKKI
jgi:hypothetical protein